MEVLKEEMNKSLKGIYRNKTQIVEGNECISSRHKCGKKINKEKQNCGKSRNEKFKNSSRNLRGKSQQNTRKGRESQVLKTG